MNTATGQTPGKKPMNGDWKKLMFQIYGAGAVFILAIGAIWWQVLLPNQREFTEQSRSLRTSLPKQTAVLEEIRDLTKTEANQSVMFRETVVREHAAQIKALQKLCERDP